MEQSITIFFDGRERRKLFDFDDMILANLSYERARTTIAFFVDGTGVILVDERKQQVAQACMAWLHEGSLHGMATRRQLAASLADASEPRA